MKKAFWLLALCAVFVFAMSATAFANVTSTYAPWSALGDNAAIPSPHNGYTLTTVKCAVCHAVHKAPAAGEILLRDTAQNACVYCHVSNAISSKIVYNGSAANYTTDSNQAHDVGGGNAASCTGCHSVHGAGTITAANFADITASILKANIGFEQNAGGVYAYNSATRAAVISRFCTGCHPYYVGTYDDGTGTNGEHAGGIAGAGPWGGHVMKAGALNAYGNTKASATVQGTQVAFATDQYCTDCHDSGAGTQADNFPHYGPAKRFMKAASYFGAAAENATQSPVQDGVCLKCHANATNGVNKNF